MRSPTHDPIVTDPAAVRQTPQRRLGGDERPAQVQVDHLIDLLQRGFRERLWNGRAGVVHQDIEAPERGDGPLDRRGDEFLGVGGVRLDRDGLAAGGLDGSLPPPRRRRRPLRIGDGDGSAVGGQTAGDRRANPARAAGHERELFDIAVPLPISLKVRAGRLPICPKG